MSTSVLLDELWGSVVRSIALDLEMARCALRLEATDAGTENDLRSKVLLTSVGGAQTQSLGTTPS